MKRIVTFMMAIALILSLSVTAFAAGGIDAEGSITITNAVVGETYSVYKIFDATYEGTSVTYTIDKVNNPFFDKLFGAGYETDYFVYHDDTGVVTRKVDEHGTPIKGDPDLFKYLNGLLEGVSATKAKEAETTTVTIGSLEDGYLATGYYVISRTNGTANGVTITTIKPSANVIDKNLLPGGDIDKVADKDTDEDDKFTVNVGDTINWTVGFTATNYDDGEKVLNYTITDALTPPGWAEINNGEDDITVTVGGTEISNYEISWTLVDGKVNGFEINIPWVDAAGEFLYDASAKVEISYSATVLDAAATNAPAALLNTATVSWGSDTTYEDTTETEVYNLGFTKVDGTNGSGLPGAVFELYRTYNTETKEYSDPVYVKSNGADGVYIFDKTSTSNSVTTPTSGQVVIQGLAAGTYYLKETSAPAGYNKLTEPVTVVVAADPTEGTPISHTVGTYTVNNAKTDVQNFSGVELPSTGGEGTMMMITIGTMIAIAFAVLLITQKKMSVYQD